MISRLPQHGIELRTEQTDSYNRTSIDEAHLRRLYLDALYGDEQVLAVLEEFKVPLWPESGSLAQRFGAPQPSNPCTKELCETVGLSTRQIELVTGIPQRRLLRDLHAGAA